MGIGADGTGCATPGCIVLIMVELKVEVLLVLVRSCVAVLPGTLDVLVTSMVIPPVIIHSRVVALPVMPVMAALLLLRSRHLLTSVIGSIVVRVMMLWLTSVTVARPSVITEVMRGTGPWTERISVLVVGMACRSLV
jgi:hypothetical protein